MFPLTTRKLIRGCSAHIKAGLGCAADYEALYINDYVPFDGILENYWGTEGGNWCRLTRPNGDKIEMAHHSKFLLKNGLVKEGQLMAVTGNTGSITTKPHLHIQIINKQGKRLDPETYDWNPMIQMPFTAVANNLNVPSSSLQAVADMMKTFSRNRINLPFDIKNTSFDPVPFAALGSIVGPETNWYRTNVTPLCTGKVSILLMNDAQWQGNTTGAMTWGDTGKPGRVSLHYIEATFVEQAFHELCHALLFFTGQKDGYTLNGEQRFVVHDYLFKFEAPPDKYGLLDSVDYTKLQTALNGIIPEGESMAKYFKVNDHGKLGIMILEGFSGTVLFENENADYQELLKITEGTENAPTINIP